MKLSAPAGATSVSVFGIVHNIVDGIVEVADHLVNDLIGSHGFSVFMEPIVESAEEIVAKMGYKELAKFLQEKGVEVAAGANKNALVAAAIKALKAVEKSA